MCILKNYGFLLFHACFGLATPANIVYQFFLEKILQSAMEDAETLGIVWDKVHSLKED
jgi:hypothetical protein